MTNNLVTVTCPLSTLRTIVRALDWAEHRASFRADIIMHLEALHNDDPKIPAGYLDTIDDVKHYHEDAKQFRTAHELANDLYLRSHEVTDPEVIEFYNWSIGLLSDDEVPLSMLQAVADGTLY